MAPPRCPHASPAAMQPRRRRVGGRAMRALLGGAFAASLHVCGADKAAYSLDLIGIKSGTAYTVVVDVGSASPAQSFRLIADTGSSNDAVLGSGCCGSDAAATFSCEASSTCVASTNDISLVFAGATISGDFVKDTWSSPEFGSLTKEFLVIEEQDSFYRSEYDGITGLAYTALKKPKNSPKASLYEGLVQAKSGTADVFGMQLCGILQPLLTSNNFSMHAGQMIVGGSEGPKGETYFTGPILYTPIAQEAWYVVVVSDIGFDGKSLGLPCSSYNQPQAIIDSGTSNIAFPSDVYNALMTLIKAATKKAEPTFADTYFDFSNSCCKQNYCDPRDAAIALLTLPSIYITLARQDDESSGTTSHYTVEIPPEYYFRPEMNGANSDVPCRAIGVAEGSAIVLGDVFMDGLFAYHDRAESKLGLAVADNCPNGVKSTKKITKTTTKTDNWCDCFSDNLKSKSTLAHYVPWGGGCFFMPWWLWVVIASAVVVLVCVGVLGYWYCVGRRDKARALEIQASAIAPTNMEAIHSTHAAPITSAAKSAPPAQPRQPPSQQQMPGQNYSLMSSPREMLDSRSSSIALLSSHEDPLSARRPPPASSTHAHQSYHVQDGKQPPPGRKDSDRSTTSSGGFLL